MDSDSRFQELSMLQLEAATVAKQERDMIRGALIHELRQVAGLPVEVLALLKADEFATAKFQAAMRDESTQHEERKAA